MYRVANNTPQISFTFILPLFPRLLQFYRDLDVPSASPNAPAIRLPPVRSPDNNAFAIPSNDRFPIVLPGGGLGPLFPLRQAIASPILGRFAHRPDRRSALLCSMAGNSLPVALW